MKKEFFNLLPYFSFDCDLSLVQELLAELTSISTQPQGKISNQLNEILLNRDNCFYNENLLNWLDQCLLTVKTELLIKPEIDLPIIACWANRSKRMQGHHMHLHPNSFLSGILYLTSHDSGFTHFSHKNYWFDSFQNYTLSDINTVEVKIQPTAGKLILFPSHLHHKVSGLTSNEIRYTISFNTFLSGKLGNFSSDLEIYAKPLKEIIKDREQI